MINVHASLLPKYRGAAPIQRAIIDGEAVTGVTIMRIETLLDAGAMLAKVTRPIGPDDTSDVVERDLARLGADLLLEVLEQIAAGTAAGGTPGLHARDVRAAADEGRRGARLVAAGGVHPQPRPRSSPVAAREHAISTARRIILLKTRVEPARPTPHPGTIVDVSADAIHVATGHGERIAIEQLQPEGRRPMSAREFAAGRRLKPGMRFTQSMTAPARIAAYHALRAIADERARPPLRARARSRASVRRARPRADRRNRHRVAALAAEPRSPRRAFRQSSAGEGRSRRPAHPQAEPLPAAAPRSRAGISGRGRRRRSDAASRGKGSASGFVNAVLRSTLRQRNRLPLSRRGPDAERRSPRPRSRIWASRTRIPTGWSRAGSTGLDSTRPSAGSASTTRRRG